MPINGYILDENGNPVQVPLEKVNLSDDSVIARTQVGSIVVSTVFLYFDHGFSQREDGGLVLFETMVNRGYGLDQGDQWGEQERHDTLQNAVKGHLETTQRVFSRHHELLRDVIPRTQWGELSMSYWKLRFKPEPEAGPSIWARLLTEPDFEF